jgi:hypothetical protein
MEKKTVLILIGLTILAFFLRSYLFPDNLFFGPEQGRDFKVIRDIVLSHKFTLIGSKTDIAGVFHGPIFYYLAAIPFFLYHGDPYAVVLFLIAIQSLTVFVIYLLALELTGNRRSAFISTILFTVSYGAVSYSRWLSNPPLTIPLSALFMLFLLRFLKGRKRSLIGAAITFGLMGQAEFINYVLAGVTGIVIAIRYYKKIIIQPKVFLFFSFCIALIFSIGNFVLFDVRHEFLILKSIFSLLTGTKGYYISLSQSFMSSYSMFIHSSMNILGLPNEWITQGVLLFVFWVLFVSLRKKHVYFILFTWLLIPNIVLIVLRHGALEQLYVFLVVGLVIGVTVAINYIGKKFCSSLGTLMLILLAFANILLFITSLPTNYRIFFQSTQPELRYKDQMDVVEYVYKRANGRKFYFQSYTIPYFWQDGWEYLFWFIGKKYEYALPDEKHDELLYVIIQKDRSNPRFQQDWYKNTVSTWGSLQSAMTFGEITVEERLQSERL